MTVLDPAPKQKDDSFKEDSRPVRAAAVGLGHSARFGGSLEEVDSSANADMADESLAGRHSYGRHSARGSDRKTRRRGRRPRAGGFGGGSAPAAPRADADDADACREAALTLLDAAARSSGALARRLVDKGFDTNVVDQVIDRLTKLGLVDDLAYAQDLLRSCLHRTMGERGVLSEMTRKGLDPGLAAQVVAQASREGLFVDSAYELGRKVARKTAGLDLKVRKRRFWSAGSRKGHSPGLLNQVAADLFVSDDPLD
ncbi:regulatory protein RecX [Bifidobacterium asteroides]|uniref:regulatory protein RecX n=1 Tax=Bifidobacterium asteroides TaxID=1684 RepID=UPI0021AD3738|nr:regulatory protein RecX [Bifidobacterium asteroides]